LRQAIDEASGKLQTGMMVLASVGSSAPFVSLFGVVRDIYHALVDVMLVRLIIFSITIRSSTSA
jgi:biopolymer transport protein ExbB